MSESTYECGTWYWLLEWEVGEVTFGAHPGKTTNPDNKDIEMFNDLIEYIFSEEPLTTKEIMQYNTVIIGIGIYGITMIIITML